MTVEAHTRMTAAEYLKLPESNKPMELINGEVILSPSYTVTHQRCALELLVLLGKMNLPGELFIGLLDVHLDDKNVVQPDFMWIDPQGKGRVTELRIEGAPGLVIEILSAISAKRDKVVKFDLYQRHGVREYWIVSAYDQYVEVYHLIDGKFVLQGVYTGDEPFISSVLGDKPVDLSTVFTD